MGCCFSSPDGDDEREHLLQSNNRTQTQSAKPPQPAAKESARPPRPAATADVVQRSGSFTARCVGVPGHYETMKNELQTLASRYHCPNNDSLSECLKQIMENHELCHISLEVKGYDFSLMVRSEAEIPSQLKQTQENVTDLSRAAKAVIFVSSKLQEMIDWLLRAEDSMISQIEAAESRHLEQRRLVDNLRENLREAQRAKELSPK